MNAKRRIPSETTVAVLMGGWSSEREVSLRSGEACAKAAERAGFRVSRVDVARDVATVLDRLVPQAAARGGGVIALFGSAGERDTAKRPQMGRIAGDHAPGRPASWAVSRARDL